MCNVSFISNIPIIVQKKVLQGDLDPHRYNGQTDGRSMLSVELVSQKKTIKSQYKTTEKMRRPHFCRTAKMSD